MSTMPRPRPPFVQRERSRHGKTVWYFRRGDGPRIRLPAPYTDGFEEAYQMALRGQVPEGAKQPRARSGTLGWLIERYIETGEFLAYAAITQRNRRAGFAAIAKERGDVPLTAITRAVIQRSIDARKPFAARTFVKTLRPMFAWAVAAGHVVENPTIGIRLPKARVQGFHTWTPEEVEQYEARHPTGTMARLALDVMLYTGLRRADAVVVGRQHIKGGWLTIRTSKTGAVIERPILGPLARSIDATDVRGLTLLTSAWGEAFASPAAFGNWFRDRCVEAGVPGRAHGLRKAAAVILAERGATVDQLMAIFGWSSAHQAVQYTRQANRRKMSAEVSRLLEGGDGG